MEQEQTESTGVWIRLRNFLQDTVLEMKKSSWPSRQELIESTVVVIIAVLGLSIFVALCDQVLMKLLRLIVR